MALVTIADVASHLNWTAPQTIQYTAEMQGFIDGVTPVIEDIVGSITSTPCDEWYDGGGTTLTLLHTPVISVTAVTESYGSNTIYVLTEQPLDGSVAANAWGFTVSLRTGEITRRAVGVEAPFAPGRRNVHVTYVAGRTATPANVRLATLDLIRLTWKSQQGGPRPGFIPSPGDAEPSDGQWIRGFFVPNAVMEQLMPSRRVPGIA